MFRKADNERVKLIKNTLTDEKRKQYNEKTRERMVRYRQRKKEEGRKEKKKSVTRATSQTQRMKWKEAKQKQRAAMSSQKRRRINERRRQRYAVTQFYSLVITTNGSCILYFRSVRQSPGTRWQIYWEFKVSLLKFSNMNLYVFTILLLWHYRVVSSIFCAEKFQGFLGKSMIDLALCPWHGSQWRKQSCSLCYNNESPLEHLFAINCSCIQCPFWPDCKAIPVYGLVMSVCLSVRQHFG